MTLKDFTARVRQAIARVTHFSATIALANRRIKHWRAEYLATFKHPGRFYDPQGSRQKARRRIIYWKTRRKRAEDFRRNWRTLLKRRRAQKRRYKKNHPPLSGEGFARWLNPDGTIVLVAPWMVGLADGPNGKRHNWLAHAKRLGWSGLITSGVRTPEHSVELCEEMCGAPSCPGRCAGLTSNHNCDHGCPYPEGAIDTPDFARFGAIMEEIGGPLRNDLPIDPVHYSVSGH